MSLRKGWNEAMMSVGAGLASAGGRNGSVNRRSSDRRKKQARRDKARKSSSALSSGREGDSSRELREYRWAARLDTLEGVAAAADGAAEDDDDFYDEEDDGGNLTAAAKRRSKKRRAARSKAGALPKRLKARSLASVLMAEDSVVQTNKYLQAEARPDRSVAPPARKFCPVTGLFGIYTDPKSGIPYANLKALEQIREREPPWLTSTSVGTAAYYEAVKSLRGDE